MTESITRTDLHRDIGRMEGRLDGMDERLGKIETIVERIDSRMAKLETKDNRRSGAWGVLELIGATVVMLIGGIGGTIIAHFWK